jgi:hypothetical protein
MLDDMSMPIGRFPVRQVVLHGGHDLHMEVPEQVVAKILNLTGSVWGGRPCEVPSYCIVARTS